jgi:oxygen-independent coproporphyrinogen-3 oxidase
LRERLDLSGLEEWTMEANPRTFDAGKVRQMVEAGVTRVSLGVQSWAPRHLATLGRDHSPDEADEAFRLLREGGVPVVNVDHMFALPGQSIGEWEADLERTIALAPEHVSTYNLTYEEDTEFMSRFQSGEFRQDADEDSEFFQLAHDKLEAAGFTHYETSNFAGPGGRDFRSRHNMAYWRGEDYLGLGPGAVSTVHHRRWTNVPDTARYIGCAGRFGQAAVDVEEIGTGAWLVERIALELRTREGLRLELLDDARRAVLAGLEADGLVESGAGRARLTESGRLLADSIAAALV